jgi:hypothetical protein
MLSVVSQGQLVDLAHRRPDLTSSGCLCPPRSCPLSAAPIRVPAMDETLMNRPSLLARQSGPRLAGRRVNGLDRSLDGPAGRELVQIG